MVHSGIGRRAAIVVLDFLGVLTLPAAALALARGHVDLAIAGSAVATLVSSARAFVTGWVIEGALRRTWREVVDASSRQSLLRLRSRRAEDESIPILLDAIREASLHHATYSPHVWALGLALGVVGVTALVVLGPLKTLLGLAALGLVGALMVYAQSRLRPLHDRAWRESGALALDTRVLVEAGAELRAHARDRAFASRLLERVHGVARAERTAATWSVALGLLPALLSLLALAGPVRAGFGWARAALALDVAQLGVIGGTALLLVLAFARSYQTLGRAAPHLRALESFLSAAEPIATGRQDTTRTLPGSLRDAPFAFEDVSCRYEGAAHATPEAFSHLWSPGRGLALTGSNGAGKSSLALLLLGLIEPTGGRIRIHGVPLAELDHEKLHERVAYLPQGPFVALGSSVAWHLGYLARVAPSAADLDRVLARVGLLPVLQEHTRRAGGSHRDVLAGELSGGERQRMHLARLLLEDADLLVLDEPEAALDDAGRMLLRDVLGELAASRRVLLIAHDEAVIPASFERVQVVRER